METLKQVFAVIGGFVGVIGAVLTVYAKFLDLKKRAATESKAEDDEAAVLDVQPVVAAKNDAPRAVRVPHPGARSAAVAQAAAMVKAPAVTIIIVGFVGILFNLMVAGYGYVDEFVTPLSDRTQPGKPADSINRGSSGIGPDQVANGENAEGTYSRVSDRASTVLTIMMLLAFSVACGAAVWAGFNMLYLRSYWFSVAGSFAIMPGACICCVAGVPIGIWALSVLRKPEVSSAFT